MQVIVILRVRSDATEEQQEKQRKAEAQAVWKLVASGVLRSIHFHDGPGALLALETGSKAEAEKIVSALPMVNAGVVTYEILHLKPFVGFEDLFNKDNAS